MLDALGGIVAPVGLAVGWAIHAMKVSHGQGELKQRVKALEEGISDFREVRDSVIRMEGRMENLESLMGELRDGLVWMTKSAPLYGPPTPPSRPARARAAK